MAKSLSNSVLKLSAIGSAAAMALVAAQPALADDHSEDSSGAAELTEGEQRLARLLEGRVAGEPQSCIRNRLNDRFTVIDGTAYVYGRGNTIYVQRTRDPEDIDRFDTLVTRRFGGSQVCKHEIRTTVDATTGMFTGAVFFDDFIPYTRVEEADS